MGVGRLGITGYQKLESPSLRNWLGLDANFIGGIRISGMSPMGGLSENKLRVNDVLVSIDGAEIGQDATVPIPERPSERINFLAVVTRKPPGAQVAVAIRRPQPDGKPAKLIVENITLFSSHLMFKVPHYDGYDGRPSYFIIGGLVFVPLTPLLGSC